MPKYEVHWVKTFYHYGKEEIEAPSEEEAKEIALAEICNYDEYLITDDIEIESVKKVTDMCNEDEWIRSSEQTIKEMCNE